MSSDRHRGEQSIAGVAGARLQILRDNLAQPHGPRPADAPPGRTSHTHGAPPLDLAVLEHVRASVDELLTHARTEARTCFCGCGKAVGCMPTTDLTAAYAWFLDEGTADLDAGKARVREAIVYRQSLEHALRYGDEVVIRRESCPGCQCWSLIWRQIAQRAGCINSDCRGKTGRGSTWTLQQLAENAVEKTYARAATS